MSEIEIKIENKEISVRESENESVQRGELMGYYEYINKEEEEASKKLKDLSIGNKKYKKDQRKTASMEQYSPEFNSWAEEEETMESSTYYKDYLEKGKLPLYVPNPMDKNFHRINNRNIPNISNIPNIPNNKHKLNAPPRAFSQYRKRPASGKLKGHQVTNSSVEGKQKISTTQATHLSSPVFSKGRRLSIEGKSNVINRSPGVTRDLNALDYLYPSYLLDSDKVLSLATTKNLHITHHHNDYKLEQESENILPQLDDPYIQPIPTPTITAATLPTNTSPSRGKLLGIIQKSLDNVKKEKDKTVPSTELYRKGKQDLSLKRGCFNISKLLEKLEPINYWENSEINKPIFDTTTKPMFFHSPLSASARTQKFLFPTNHKLEFFPKIKQREMAQEERLHWKKSESRFKDLSTKRGPKAPEKENVQNKSDISRMEKLLRAQQPPQIRRKKYPLTPCQEYQTGEGVEKLNVIGDNMFPHKSNMGIKKEAFISNMSKSTKNWIRKNPPFKQFQQAVTHSKRVIL